MMIWQRTLLATLISLCSTTLWAQDAIYQDRLLSDMGVDTPEDQNSSESTSGLPRQWMTDFLWGERRQQRDDQQQHDQDVGVGFNGFLQTQHWGAWSVDATLYQQENDRKQQQGVSGTIWQRHFWLTNDWMLNQSFGTAQTPLPELMRLPSRFIIPTQPLLGWSLEAQHTDQQVWQASIGQTGQYQGQRVRGFAQADGDLYYLAHQQRLDPYWQMAGLWLSTRGSLNPDTLQPIARDALQTDAGVLSLAWQQPTQRLQFNLIHSQTPEQHDIGGWLDGQTVRGRYDHQYGLFWLEPDLGWGGSQLSQDAKGGYYRLNYQYARWLWNVSLDQIYSVSGNSFSGQYANTYVRYQAPLQRAYGAQLSIRHDLDQREFLYQSLVFGERPNRLGTQRWQAEYQHQPNLHRTQLSLDQAIDWDLGQRLSLTTSYIQEKRVDNTQTGIGLGMYGTLPLSTAWRLDGSARIWQLDDNAGQDTQRDLNLTLHYQPSNTWQYSLSVYDVQGQQQLNILDPLTPVNQRHQVEERSLLLTLRHVYQAGKTQPIIGGHFGDPYGTVSGEVFLDTNQDGIRNGSEVAAPDVTVMLDGRYMARTDAQGRFRFEQVRVGSHQLSVSNDELPLPWQIADARLQQTIEVRVRQTHHIAVGAVRPY